MMTAKKGIEYPARFVSIGRNRGRFEVCLQICNYVKENGGATVTDIMYATALSYHMCKYYICQLSDRKILIRKSEKKGTMVTLSTHGAKWAKAQSVAIEIFNEKARVVK